MTDPKLNPKEVGRVLREYLETSSSEQFRADMLRYNPDLLDEVAAGSGEPWKRALADALSVPVHITRAHKRLGEAQAALHTPVRAIDTLSLAQSEIEDAIKALRELGKALDGATKLEDLFN